MIHIFADKSFIFFAASSVFRDVSEMDKFFESTNHSNQDYDFVATEGSILVSSLIHPCFQDLKQSLILSFIS